MRQKLKDLRLAKGQTQKEIAENTGTTKEFFGLLENGKRVGTVPYWLRLQRAYKLSDAELWAIVKEGVKIESKNKRCGK